MDAMTFINRFGWDEVDRICAEAGTKRSWFYQIALGHANCGAKLAKRLVEASGKKLDFWSLIEAEDPEKVARRERRQVSA